MTYRLGDHPSRAELQALGLPTDNKGDRFWLADEWVYIRGMEKGLVRPPQRGEWFLGQGGHRAFRAGRDMSVDREILVLVLARKLVTWEVIT